MAVDTDNKGVGRLLEISIVVIFFSAFAFSLAEPVKDPDVFWHIKTGEWIWKHKALPDNDPFTFTGEQLSDPSAKFTLRQYWLSQLIMYGFYDLFGFYGIILFRCLIYLAIALALYHWMGKEGIARIGRLIFLAPVAYFSAQQLGERPNNLSFLFAVIVVYLLEKLRAEGRGQRAMSNEQRVERLKLETKDYYLLPLVMLLWANMHGGFVLGDVIIAICMTAEGLKRLRGSKSPALVFYIICLVSIFTGFINPNTYNAVYRVFGFASGKYSAIPITEHMSPFYYAKMGVYYYLVVIAVMIVPFLPRLKRLDLNSALLIAFLAAIALNSGRYIPFLVFIATPFIARLWGDVFGTAIKKMEKFYIPALVVVSYAVLLFVTNFRFTVFSGDTDLTSSFYPERMVRFIKTEKPEGEIFNRMVLGGYLIWSLYPDYRVFIDGRRLYQDIEPAYLKAHSGSSAKVNGIPEWKAVLNAYNVKMVIIPNCTSIGDFVKLVQRLVDDNEWSLVYIDNGTLLFIRDGGRNREIIRRHSMPKMLAYEKALEQAELYRAQYPKSWMAYTTLGEVNIYLGRPNAALMYLEIAMELNPSLKSTNLSGLIERLKTGQDYRELIE